jgi:hypothetical protein
MQVDLSVVMSVAGGGIGLYVTLLRYTISQQAKTYEKQFELLTVSQASTLARLVDEEKNTIRLDGEIALAKLEHSQLTSAVTEIKESMITKVEFEPRMTNLERTLNSILSELRGASRFQSGSMQGVKPQGTPR